MGIEHSFSVPTLLIILAVLILFSAFFSGAETALMSVNRYRLRHMAKDEKHRGAKRVLTLLARTDRLLTVVLMGNTVANIFASSVATLLGAQLFGKTGVIIATVSLTLVVLIFAEIGPKTITARHPQGFALFSALPLQITQAVLYPFVWLGNTIVKLILLPFHINISHVKSEVLTAKELKHIVKETDDSVSPEDEKMLVGILELEDVSVQDIMIPRAEILGINLEDDWQTIFKQLVTSQHSRLPLYSKNLDDVHGILHIRDILHAFAANVLDKEKLLALAHEVHYVPELTRLDQQLANFQQHKTRVALVVDEYGEIHGMITLEDILEEVVGNFTTNVAEATETAIIPQPDGSYIVEASQTIRELNRHLKIHLPTDRAKTLNGLIIAYLDDIPNSGTCVKIKRYPLEIIKVSDNLIKTVQLFPRLPRH